MQTFVHVLVILDRPSAGVLVARAVELSRRTGAGLTLACLPDEGDAVSPIDSWLQSLGAAAPGAALRTLDRGSGDEIVGIVRREGHDLVMKTAASEGLLPQLQLTLDEQLLRDCPCPVWLDRQAGRRGRILAAIDPQPPGLAAAVLDMASWLAAIEQAELHVVHGWELEGESAMRGQALTQAAEAEIDALAEAERARHAAAIEALLEPYGRGPAAPALHLEKGQADIVVPQQVEALGAGLLVMGSVTEGGLGGLVMRNTAEEVLPRIGCTLVAVKPAGPASNVPPDEGR